MQHNRPETRGFCKNKDGFNQNKTAMFVIDYLRVFAFFEEKQVEVLT